MTLSAGGILATSETLASQARTAAGAGQKRIDTAITANSRLAVLEPPRAGLFAPAIYYAKVSRTEVIHPKSGS